MNGSLQTIRAILRDFRRRECVSRSKLWLKSEIRPRFSVGDVNGSPDWLWLISIANSSSQKQLDTSRNWHVRKKFIGKNLLVSMGLAILIRIYADAGTSGLQCGPKVRALDFNLCIFGIAQIKNSKISFSPLAK